MKQNIELSLNNVAILSYEFTDNISHDLTIHETTISDPVQTLIIPSNSECRFTVCKKVHTNLLQSRQIRIDDIFVKSNITSYSIIYQNEKSFLTANLILSYKILYHYHRYSKPSIYHFTSAHCLRIPLEDNSISNLSIDTKSINWEWNDCNILSVISDFILTYTHC